MHGHIGGNWLPVLDYRRKVPFAKPLKNLFISLLSKPCVISTSQTYPLSLMAVPIDILPRYVAPGTGF